METNGHGRRVSRWKDGELSSGEANRVEAHIAECEECRKAADVIDAVRRHIGEWTAPETSADLPQRVLSQVHARAANILSMKLHLRLTAAAAALLLVASLAVYPFVGGTSAAPGKERDDIADVALEEMMGEIAEDNLPGPTGEEEDR
ncbi:MAG: anti-sigma factor [Planctomycetota bacterium]